MLILGQWSTLLISPVDCDCGFVGGIQMILCVGRRAQTLPLPPHSPKRKSNDVLVVFLGFGVSGGLESTQGNHTSRMGRLLNYLVMGNVRKPIETIFRVFCTSDSSPVLPFSPRTPRSHLWGNPKTDACRKSSRFIFCITSFGAAWYHFVKTWMPLFDSKN